MPMSAPRFQLEGVSVITECAAIYGKLYRITPRTMASCLDACQRLGTVQSNFGHGENAPPLGTFENFRRSGPSIIATFTSDYDGDPIGLAKLATAARFDARMLGFSVSPDSHVENSEVIFDAVESIDLCDAPSANPGGLLPPTQEDLDRQERRANWEFDQWQKILARRAG